VGLSKQKKSNLTSLNSFAEGSNKSGPIAWRELNESNRAAWTEACKGIKSGIPARTAAKWLIEERNCPLMLDTLRVQLKNTMDTYVKS